jgi:GH15 family glucan-1,4-alpha-glucosidase
MRADPDLTDRDAIDVGSYPPIGDYAAIGDGHTVALVSRAASVDWLCLPRFDGDAVFGRLLDRERGGCCVVEPVARAVRSSRRYLDGTMVLETRLATADGEVTVVDCLAVDEDGETPRRRLIRLVEGVRGALEVRLLVRARFDFGELKPWVRRHGAGYYSAVGGNDALLVSGPPGLEVVDQHDMAARVVVRPGERIRLVIAAYSPEELDPAVPEPPDPADVDRWLDDTAGWWRQWTGRLHVSGPVKGGVERSAMALRALVHAPTGAVVAAPTTSLPESIGHERNWDYRYTWVRDSQFTVRSLAELGCGQEADGLRRFLERSAAGSAESVQIMYGVGGERRLPEIELDLDGYCGSRPVRIGNRAAAQRQLDVYGYLLDLAWRWHERGHSPDDDYWRFLLGVVDRAVELWTEPDQGIWEMRGAPQHFVHSKVMCWAAVDRGVRLAEGCLRTAPVDDWIATRDEIRAAVERDGYDTERGIFVQTFGGSELDAALLLLPRFDFVDDADERMVRTVDAIRADLDDGGLLRRYRRDDGLSGREGAFVACSFWLVECLAAQGRGAEAQEVFDRAVGTANDLGLFAEEYDPVARVLLGNFPQGLSHLSHIAAALSLGWPP